MSELFSINELQRLRDEGVDLDDVEFDQDIANNIPDIPLNLGTIKEASNKYSQASKAPKTWLESILAKNQINLENEEQFFEEIQDQESDSENLPQEDVKVKMPSDKKSEKTQKVIFAFCIFDDHLSYLILNSIKFLVILFLFALQPLKRLQVC